MRIAGGTVLDRPWGQTLGTVGLRKVDAQVTVRSDDGKTYAVAFVNGAVVAAASPLPNDAVTRVALTSHFVSPSQVTEITRRLAAEKDHDEVDVIVDAAKLSDEHAATLRKRLTIQRAARTFAIDRATFEIDDQITLRRIGGFSVPTGAVIFHGVRMNLSEQRLVEDMREIGTSFHLRPATTDADIAAYEFEGDTRSVLSALRKGTSLAELELASHRDIEPRTLHAMLYALVCGGHCDAAGGQPVDRTAPPAPRTSTGFVPNKVTKDQRARTTGEPANVARPLTPASEVLPNRQTTPPANVARTLTPVSEVFPGRTTSPTAPPAQRTPTQPPLRPTPSPFGPRTPTQPPASRTPTLPPASRTPTQPPRTVTPIPGRGTMPPPRTGTLPPPRAPTTLPLDEFAREPTTSRGFTGAEGTPPHVGTGPFAIIEEFSTESSTNRGIQNTTPAVSRTITAPRTITERNRAKREIEVLIASRLSRLEQGCDYFAILGLPFEAPLDAVRNNYVETSRRLHPGSLAQVGILDEDKGAQRVLAQVHAAFNTLNDPAKRRDYIAAVRRGDATPIAPRARTGDLDKAELAAEAFEAGEGALKRDDIARAVEELNRAVTLAPTNLEYMAMLAWAQFCAAPDKPKVYPETRKALERAIHRGDKPIVARFYLGRVERMVGHDREAFNHFQEVLLDEPNNREAQTELRVLEQKIARNPKPKR